MKTNLLGKLFFASLGLWVVGKVTKTKLRGTPEEIRAVAEALTSSKHFQDELSKPGASVQSVLDKLDVKNMSAEKFERIFGMNWPI